MDNTAILSEDFLNITEESKPGKRLLKSPEASKKEQIADAKFEKKLKKLTKKKLGFTNTLAIYLVLLLTLTLGLGFYLALESIRAQYTGALICWSCVIGPLDACLGVVLVRVVDKSRAENTGADGNGISYALAMAEAEGKKYGNSEAFKKAMQNAMNAANNAKTTTTTTTSTTVTTDTSAATQPTSVCDPDEDMTGGNESSDNAAIDSPAI
nr:MAG TPA: Malarial early transcribed membrane protein (ETRAMP) [Caudoviricetes sp.]